MGDGNDQSNISDEQRKHVGSVIWRLSLVRYVDSVYSRRYMVWNSGGIVIVRIDAFRGNRYRSGYY